MSDKSVDQIKVPPHSIEAEQAVIGGLLLNNQAWDEVADRIVDGDFYRRDHRLLFKAIENLADKGMPYDAITLSEALDSNEELENAGGIAYITRLSKDTPSASNIKAYADIVRERSILRQLIGVSNEIADMAFDTQGRPSKELLEQAERLVYKIADEGSRAKNGFVGIKPLLKTVVEKIETLYQQDGPVTGVPTGFDDFDEMTSGLQGGDLVIVAGRPSMGKTTFAMNIAENAAIKTKKPVAVFSMEMPGDSLVMRMISSLGRINQGAVRSGDLKDDDWPRVTSAVSILNDAPLFIDDTPGLSPTELRSRARRLARENNGEMGLIVVDYLQLMQVPGGGENRATEISEISRSLKGVAKELNCPMIALSQLNRSLEQRPNKRPINSDLRESGAIEQDADLIVFIYRDEVYNPESPDKGIAEVIIGKQRNGPIGTCRLTFQGQFTRFDNYVPDTYGDPGF